ncbi:hypothetical protein AZOA_45450 [Azoarcus sp. Aa7]|nr:hypothetical protein [Azoarcus sp. Aa7]
MIRAAISKAILRLEEGGLVIELISRQTLGEFLQGELKDVPGITDMEPESLCTTYLSRARTSGYQLEPKGTPTGRKGADYNKKAKEELKRAWRVEPRRETLPSPQLVGSGER